MRRYRLSLTLAILAAAAGAASAEPSVAVLGIEPVDVPEPLTQALTDALRQRASATGGIRMVPGKDLVELKMIFGCDGEQVACMSQAGRSLGADKLLYGTLKKAAKNSNNVVVALKLLDVNSATVEKFVNDTVPKKDLAGGNVNAAAAKWFSALVEVEAKPTLNLTTEPPNASVTVDGQPAGRTPVTLRDLTPGSHTIIFTLQGRVTVTKTVELRPGAANEIALQLEPETAPTPVTPPPTQPAPEPVVTPTQPPPAQENGHPGRLAKGLAIGAFGAAVITSAVAIYTWRSYTKLETTSHNDLKALSGMATAQNKSFFDNPNCNPGGAGLSGSGANTYKNHCSSGQSFATATTALWVTSGVLAAAGIVGVVIGEHQSNKAKKEAPKTAGRLIQQSLRLAPVFSTQAGGLQASFEF